jgi:hypothetical protein
MSHRTPGSDAWELAVRSKQLWEELAAEVDSHGGGGARERMGWMRTGTIIPILLLTPYCYGDRLVADGLMHLNIGE